MRPRVMASKSGSFTLISATAAISVMICSNATDGPRTQQAQRVQFSAEIERDFVVEGVWLPRWREKWDGHRLSKVVQVDTTHANGRHDAGVVHDFRLDSQLFCAQQQISVRRSAEQTRTSCGMG